MPPKAKVTKGDILAAAVALVRQQGIEALNARALAEKLSCSTQPVFSNYSSMEVLKRDVLCRADVLWKSYMRREMEAGEYPAYKASGMAYIRFAREETELFKLLFMRRRAPEEIGSDTGGIQEIIAVIQETTGLTYALAEKLHLEMWIFVHGVASMMVTAYLNWDLQYISGLMTDVYQSLKDRYLKEAQG